jgi:hypothetical protein
MHIIVHFVFAVKHDIRHKARLFDSGNLADSDIDCTFLGTVILQNMSIIIVYSELNNLNTMFCDKFSASLEFDTQE